MSAFQAYQVPHEGTADCNVCQGSCHKPDDNNDFEILKLVKARYNSDRDSSSDPSNLYRIHMND